MSKRLLSCIVAIATTTACQSRGAESRAAHTGGDTSAAVATRSDTSGMAAMPGMGGSTMIDTATTTMMDAMRAELTRMHTMSPEQMTSAMSSHRQAAGNLLAQMNGDMRRMNMTGDAAWMALVDSVRQDLVRMPDVSGAQLKTLIIAHEGRMERLMAMHREMMGRMSDTKK